MFSTLFLKIDRSRYQFADALVNFDPVNDWLLNKTSYLTWREWGQQLPGDSEPIALMSSPDNFILKPKDWMGKEFFWMGSVMSKRFSNPTNSRWQSSNYRGLLSQPRDREGRQELLDKLTEFNSLVAPSIGCIQLVEDEEDFEDKDDRRVPSLSFDEDGQIKSLIVRSPYHGAQNPIWRFILPTLVERFKKYQLEQLELVA